MREDQRHKSVWLLRNHKLSSGLDNLAYDGHQGPSLQKWTGKDPRSERPRVLGFIYFINHVKHSEVFLAGGDEGLYSRESQVSGRVATTVAHAVR